MLDTTPANQLISRLSELANRRGPSMGQPAMSAEDAMSLAWEQMSQEDCDNSTLED